MRTPSIKPSATASCPEISGWISPHIASAVNRPSSPVSPCGNEAAARSSTGRRQGAWCDGIELTASRLFAALPPAAPDVAGVPVIDSLPVAALLGGARPRISSIARSSICRSYAQRDIFVVFLLGAVVGFDGEALGIFQELEVGHGLDLLWLRDFGSRHGSKQRRP